MMTTRSLVRRALGYGFALAVPVFVARLVGAVGLRLGLDEGAALAWGASALLCQSLVLVGAVVCSSGRTHARTGSPVLLELLTERVLTYYVMTGTLIAASFRALLFLSPAFGLLAWPLAGAILLLTLREFFFPVIDHLRGRRLLPVSEARAAARRLLVREERGLPWGGIRIPSRFGVLHFVTIGAPGSGKTLTIRMLLGEFVARMRPGAGRRALVYDAKRDMVSILAGMSPGVPIKILNPFDTRSTRWAIAKDARSPAVCMQMAEALIRVEEGANQFFSLAGIEIVSSVMVAFNLSAPGNWTLRDLILATHDPLALRLLLERHPETRGALVHFREERMLASILATVRVRLAQLEPIAAAWDRAEGEVSLEDWTSGEMILILGNDETTRVCLDAINRVILRRSVELILNGPEVDDWRSLFVLDEVAQAGKLDALSSLLTKGRSKGAAVVIGFQDMDGLRQVYEKGADELVGQCATKAILRIESPSTAEWASRVVGESEQWEHQLTTAAAGDSTTHQRTKREGVLPSEFLSLPPATREHGLSGYFAVPEVGVFRSRVTPAAIKKLLSAKGEVADFIPRPIDHQYLRPWDAEDRERLAATGRNPLTDMSMPQPAPPVRVPLRVVKPISRERE